MLAPEVKATELNVFVPVVIKLDEIVKLFEMIEEPLLLVLIFRTNELLVFTYAGQETKLIFIVTLREEF